jgi:hypothetical protein
VARDLKATVVLEAKDQATNTLNKVASSLESSLEAAPLSAVTALETFDQKIQGTQHHVLKLGDSFSQFQNDFSAALEGMRSEESPKILGNIIRSLDPSLGAEVITEKLSEIFPEIDFEALAEEAPFFEELLRKANPEGVGSAVADALSAAQGPIRSFTGGITELQSALSVLGLQGAGPFGKFAKATAKVQAVISAAQAIFEIAEAIAAVARYDFGAAAQHTLAAAKFQVSAQAGKTAQGAIAAAAGGFVPQLPGASPFDDSVLAALTPGELVIPKPFAQEMAEMLGRSGRSGRFQEGGVVEPEGLPGAVGGAVSVVVLPAEPSVLGPLLDAMSEAVERFGFRMVASEVTT